MCPVCESPDRLLWASGHVPAALVDVRPPGNWITLRRCPHCSALWAVSPYEPYAGREFACRWPLDERAWDDADRLDGGLTLLAWHAAVIRERWESLRAEEREVVQAWRARTSYGHNPIDQGDSWRPPVSLERADDIDGRIGRGT